MKGSDRGRNHTSNKSCEPRRMEASKEEKREGEGEKKASVSSVGESPCTGYEKEHFERDEEEHGEHEVMGILTWAARK